MSNAIYCVTFVVQNVEQRETDIRAHKFNFFSSFFSNFFQLWAIVRLEMALLFFVDCVKQYKNIHLIVSAIESRPTIITIVIVRNHLKYEILVLFHLSVCRKVKYFFLSNFHFDLYLFSNIAYTNTYILKSNEVK